MQRSDRDGPIGVFDSGIGGLSVWRELIRQLPSEHTLYVADQGHVPYGPRSITEIRAFSHGITRFLLDQGAKLIVLACNTASGAALHTLRAAFPEVPFVGMEPAVKPAVERTRTGIVGVLATPTAFEGDLFKRLVDRFGSRVDIRTQVCPGLVEAVESGAQESQETAHLLQGCLAPLLAAGIDQLVLGCTHYPFARSAIERIVGPGVTVIDPSPAVARQAGRVLDARGLRRRMDGNACHRFFTSGNPAALVGSLSALVDIEASAHLLQWSGGMPRLSIRTKREETLCV